MKKTISSIVLCVMLVLSLCSNMLAFAETQTLSLDTVKGDIHDIYLTFDNDISQSTNVNDKVTVKDGSNPVSVTLSISEKVLKITPVSGEFEADKTYTVIIDIGFGTDTVATTEKLAVSVKNKAIFSENFDNLDKLSSKFVASGQFYVGQASIYGSDTNKGMYYNGNLAVYPFVENINTLENYSVSFDHKRYGTGTNDLSVMFFATATTDTAKFGYLVNLGKMTAGYNWSNWKNAAISPAMEVAGTVTTQGSWNTAPVLNETNPENNYHLSFVKKGTVVDAYVDSKLTNSYDFKPQANQSSTGYFGFYGSEKSINVIIDNLTITTFESSVKAYEEKTATLENISGDMHNVVLTFSEDMSGTTNVSDKVTIRNGANKINYTSAVSGTTIKLSAKDASFEADETYILEIGSGLGTDLTKTEEKYIKVFKNKSIFFEDFDNLDKLSTKFTQSANEYKFTTIYGEGTNKGLYYNGSRAIYPKVENINTLENYSVSFDHKRFTSSNYDLSVMFFATATTDTKKPGYLVNLEKMQPGHDWSGYDSGTLSPAMELAGTVTTQGSWNTAPVLNETNPENNYHLSFVKKGTTVEAYFGSKLVKSYNFSNQSPTGYFGFYGSEGNINVIIDNLAITTFESAEPTELIFGGINVTDTKGTSSEDDDTKITTTEQLQAAQGISGTAYVGNFSGSDKPVVIIVAMYGENNKMLDAKVVLNTTVSNGTSEEYPFTFDKNSNAVKIRCFALDTMAHLSPYEKADQMPKE